MLKQQVGFTVL